MIVYRSGTPQIGKVTMYLGYRYWAGIGAVLAASQVALFTAHRGNVLFAVSHVPLLLEHGQVPPVCLPLGRRAVVFDGGARK